MSELSDLREKVDRIAETAARTDTNVRWLREAFTHHVRRTDGHDERLRKVEGRQWWIAGIFAAIGAVLGIGGANQLKP